MPIISSIGRRSLKVRALIALIYLLLITGAVTMVYPFLLMVAGSSKSNVDTPDPNIIPPFLINDGALYQKYVEGLFNESLDMMKPAYGSTARTFMYLDPPVAGSSKLTADWGAFLAEADLPPTMYTVGFSATPRSREVLPHNLRKFKAALHAEYDRDLAALNTALATEFVSWNALRGLREEYFARLNRIGRTPFHERYREFKRRQPLTDRCYFVVEGYYQQIYLKARYGHDLAAYNRAAGTACASWTDVPLPQQVPDANQSPSERTDWLTFVRTVLNVEWLRADTAAAPAWQSFLRAKYRTIATFNRHYGGTYTDFAAVPLPAEPPGADLPLADWTSFIEGWQEPDTKVLHQLAAEHLRINSVEFLFRDWLQAKYGSLENLQVALADSAAAAISAWRDVRPPQQQWHAEWFRANRGWLRREFLVRNFLSVIDAVVVHGRAIVNTVIYCSLAILASLIVNPIAAYALSRFKPPATYKLLLFLMLTMAFPAMVTQIPTFLMLRQFQMLNTFWALILPGIASGYSIFLLKGFFDSLPRELYESAQIDGAGEFRMFWQLTMALSTPILAVTALNAFNQAYSNFMFALLICQDEKMWTLMPWLYQLQQRSGQGVVFASLLIASVPTFLIFAFCQKIIMRGIVVPVEK